MAGEVLITIRNWERHFEVSQTKKVLGPLNWVAIPTKHDGKGYRRIMARKDGHAIYAAWILMVQIAAKCPKRGELSDFDGPLTTSDFEIKTGVSAKLFDNAIQVLSAKGIEWISLIPHSTTVESIPLHSTAIPLQTDRTGQDKQNKQPPTEDCSEPPCGGSEQPSAEAVAVIMVFPCVGGGTTEWPLTSAKVTEWQESYPGVDVLGECRKARQWCIDNGSKRKTAAGMPKFLNSWLSRAQNAGGSNARTSGNYPRSPGSTQGQASPARVGTPEGKYSRFRPAPSTGSP